MLPEATTQSAALERFREELLDVHPIPAAPQIIQRILELMSREDVSRNELAALINRDPSLAARLLGLANSPFFASTKAITTIPQALMVLGFSHVRDIVVGLSLWESLEAKDAHARKRRQSLWLHSVAVAGAARQLAEHVGGDGGLAFVVGLLHDIGELVLGLRLGEAYWAMLDDAEERRCDLTVLEHYWFGCDHGEVGRWLLDAWSLPPIIGAGVAHHHLPLRAHSFKGTIPAVAAVTAADRLLTSTDVENGQAEWAVLAEVRAFVPAWDAALWRTISETLSHDRRRSAHVLAS
jgi:HD-like signal output (HDOD) protein